MKQEQIVEMLEASKEIVAFSIITKEYVMEDIRFNIQDHYDNEEIAYTEESLEADATAYYEKNYERIKDHLDWYLSEPFRNCLPFEDYEFNIDKQ